MKRCCEEHIKRCARFEKLLENKEEDLKSVIMALQDLMEYQKNFGCKNVNCDIMLMIEKLNEFIK